MKLNDLYAFWREYYSTALHEHLRIGQAFMNRFYPGEANPSIYYEEDRDRAWARILDTYCQGV